MAFEILMPFRKKGVDLFHLHYQQWDYFGIKEHALFSTLPEPLITIAYPKAKRLLRPGRRIGEAMVSHLLEKIGNASLRNNISDDFYYPNYLLDEGKVDDSVVSQLMKAPDEGSFESGQYFSQDHNEVKLFSFTNAMTMAYYFYTSSYQKYLQEINRQEFESCLVQQETLDAYINYYSSCNHFMLYTNESFKIFMQADSSCKPLLMVVLDA